MVPTRSRYRGIVCGALGLLVGVGVGMLLWYQFGWSKPPPSRLPVHEASTIIVRSLLDAAAQLERWPTDQGAAGESAVEHVLARFHGALVPYINESLDDHRDPVRRQIAARVLARIGLSAVPELVAAANDKDLSVRASAARGLGAAADPGLGAAADPAGAATLIRLLHDSEPEVRRTAAASLRAFGDPVSLGALRASLNDPAPTVRLAAAVSLAKRGGPDGFDVLLEALRLGDVPDRDAAADALADLGDPRALRPLQEAARPRGVGWGSPVMNALERLSAVCTTRPATQPRPHP